MKANLFREDTLHRQHGLSQMLRGPRALGSSRKVGMAGDVWEWLGFYGLGNF